MKLLSTYTVDSFPLLKDLVDNGVIKFEFAHKYIEHGVVKHVLSISHNHKQLRLRRVGTTFGTMELDLVAHFVAY